MHPKIIALNKLRFYVYKDSKKEWRWKAMRKGKILFEASEGYKQRGSLRAVVRHAFESIRAGDYEFTDEKGKPFSLWGRAIKFGETCKCSCSLRH